MKRRCYIFQVRLVVDTAALREINSGGLIYAGNSEKIYTKINMKVRSSPGQLVGNKIACPEVVSTRCLII